MSRNKLKRYTGAEVAQPKSIAEQLLAGTKLGSLLYGKQETYKDGNNQEREDASFNESANGQLVQRMVETAKDAGELVATGLAFGNPLTASNAMSPLIASSQAYWIGHGINDGAQRIENIGEGVKNFVEDPSWQNVWTVAKEVPMLVLDVAGALPVAKTVTTTAKQITPTVKSTVENARKVGYSVEDRMHAVQDVVNMEKYKGLYPIVENGQIVWKKPKIGDTHAVQMIDPRSKLFYHNNGVSRINPEAPRDISFMARFPEQQGYATVHPEGYINSITLTPAPGETTIPKDVMRNFWKGTRDVVRPGTYISGDTSTLPLGEQVHRAFTTGGVKSAVQKLLEKRSVKSHFGLSPDSYKSIISQASRDGYELRWGTPFSWKNWNPTAVNNAGMYPLRGESKTTYLERFNKWADEIGGRHAYVDERGIVQIPHPYIFVKPKP